MVHGTFAPLNPQARHPATRVALVAAPWLAILALWYAVRASGLVNPSLVPAPHAVLAQFVELSKGRLALGTWQAIYLWEHREAPHTRNLVVHVQGV